MQPTSLNSWLLYCRPGFEADCVQETQAGQVEAAAGSGYAIVQGKPRLIFSQLVFARQLIRLLGEVNELPERDRITPLLAALPAEPLQFSEVWLEVPDTNEGKTLSGFTRRLQPLLEVLELPDLLRSRAGVPPGVRCARDAGDEGQPGDLPAHRV